ncbi:hypothetical protein GGI12_003453 [Dipsacomyces acuminosporus]|nr:hypothetical protein GGI12_003453 [Dipsacomyces acuminosporus]
MATVSAAEEVIAHLRCLRAGCAHGKAWSSALIWAEKAFFLSDDVSDLLWLVDALMTNGQYRQAEEWLLNPLYSARCRASAAGRYLASIVAMRLGRAEDALELLGASINSSGSSSTLSSQLSSIQYTSTPAPESPATKKPTGPAYTAALDSPFTPHFQSNQQNDGASMFDPAKHCSSNNSSGSAASIPLINPKSWMLYMQGAAVIQISNIGGNEGLSSIKSLSSQYPEPVADGLKHFGSLSSVAEDINVGAITAHQHEPKPARKLGAMHSVVLRLWIEAIRTDARCWEAWTGIREYGLLTCEGELQLIASLDWSSYCGGSEVAGRFFKDYCLATLTAFALSDAATDATKALLSTYPQLVKDPSLHTIQAARLLSLGRARECLEHTTRVLEYRRVPDPSATAIHITALTILHARDALFRIAHELAEEFGISSIKRADIEPADTGTHLSASSIAGSSPDGAAAGGGPSSVSKPAVGASVAGVNRVRAGARGLLIPETPSRVGSGTVSALINGNGANSARRAGASGCAAGLGAKSVVQSASAAATAAWRGLWGLPTWTHPGPPVLATYPCALGPSQPSPVNADVAMSTVDTFTTTSAQSVGSPTQYEFIGASLAWYAIGCYYLVSASLLAVPGASQGEWALSGFSYGRQMAAGGFGLAGIADGVGAAHRRGHPLSPEAEHALSEARRWLAKTTLASPRSIVAWVTFAHTFVVAGEWESATRALHTAVGLCGFENLVHGGGRDSAPTRDSLMQTPSKQKGATMGADLFAPAAKNAADSSSGFERGSRLAHAPLASLGSVYLQMGDLGMAKSCLDASARCIGGYTIDDWIAVWKPSLESTANRDVLAWCLNDSPDIENDYAKSISLADPQLLNDIGVLYYNSDQHTHARIFFILALKALRVTSKRHSALYTAFNPLQRKAGQGATSPEAQAYSALLKANLGNTLRKLGDYDAALQCLEEAATHAPSNTNILLSVAFVLHLRAIKGFDASPDICVPDLDRAIDIYHSILSSKPGDAIATDLLSLALELSASAHTTALLEDIFGAGEELMQQQDIDLRDPSELGLPELSHSANASMQRPSSEASHDVDDASSSVEGEEGEEGEDSDEAMEIEDESDSDSDMAMD